MTTAIIAIALILLIFGSAFFSSAETAYLSLSRIKLRQLLKQNTKKTRLVNKLKSKPDILLTTILIGNNFINTFSSSLAASLAITLLGEDGAWIATVIMTVVIITFGEVIPKTLASYQPEKIATKDAQPLYVLEKILFPVVKLFQYINTGISWLFGKVWHETEPSITEEELKTLIDFGSEDGTVETDEKEMLYKIFEFSDLRIRDILKHRSFIASIPETASYVETLNKFTSSGYSRLPVIRENTTEIIGLIQYKDILFYSGSQTIFKASKIMKSIIFIPETVSVGTLLHRFRMEKQSFAAVVDEHGDTNGIVTMDDILKAVFGRITDEYNAKHIPVEKRIRITGKSEFIVPGDVSITDINSIMNKNFESEDFDTIGGWLLEQFGYLPEIGDKITKNGLLFTVEDQAGRRIQSIRIRYDKDISKAL